ncbi:hypothetical protein [Iodidimonas sp. SYSU 1G8]|uniref:hypothetical protein n=1 Tax=Iodidimonas sp. SYSU 1G8 TaxID=3133967 RepID=UPI0031FED62C
MGIARAITRHAASFAVIVALLAVGIPAYKHVRAALDERPAIARQFGELDQLRTQLAAFTADEIRRTEERVARLQDASGAALDARLAQLNRDMLDRTGRQRSRLARSASILVADTAMVRRDVENDVALALLEQERRYLLTAIAATARREKAVAETSIAVETAATAYRALSTQLQDIQRRKNDIRARHDVLVRIPWSAANRAVADLSEQERAVRTRLAAAQADYTKARRLRDLARTRTAVEAFLVTPVAAGSELDERIEALRAHQDKSWLRTIPQAIYQVLPQAVLIFIGVLLSPVLIKLFFYYVIAPIAARRAPIHILPAMSGVIATGGDDGLRRRISAVSIEIALEGGDELLVRPDYLQSSARSGQMDTALLLDWSSPLTSLASGMWGLTRIRADARERFVISATKDPFAEIGLVDIPAGSAMIVQPHNLVGLIQPRGAPVTITKHWRLGTLNAWLTLQLRYLAFHGPVTLVVMGCRGVRVERGGDGRSVNQAATIGFSANLGYSTRRCETFGAYLLGKQELLNDHFAGEDGHYVYEEMPHFGKKGSIMGRGLEGITDSLLKVFGV